MPSFLGDLYDSLGLPNYSEPGATSLMPGAGIRPLPALTPPEESSAMRVLGRKVLPGIVWAGQALDKTLGARGVRGTLAGNPRELLSTLPFSDTLGITDPADAVHGTELLRRAGLVHGEDDDWQNVLAGIAAEVALNPATYLTFGSSAVNELGQAARSLNMLPPTLAGRIGGLAAGSPEAAAVAARLGRPVSDVAGQALGGWAGVGLPFMNPVGVLGTGPAAQQAAEALGSGINSLKYSGVGRGVSSLFSSPVKGATSTPFQAGLRGDLAGQYGNYAGEIEKAMPNFRYNLAELAQRADTDPVLKSLSPLELRTAMEVPGPYAPEIANFKGDVQALKDAAFQQFKGAGADIGSMNSIYGTEHFPALNPTALDRITGRMGVTPRVIQTRFGTQIAREPIYDLPGGRATSEAIMADPAAAAGTLRQPDIFTTHLGGDLPRMTQLQTLRTNFPNMFDPAAWPPGSNMAQQAGALQKEITMLEDMWSKAGMWEKHLPTVEAARLGPTGIGMFKGVHPLTDLLDYGTGLTEGTANAHLLRSVLGQSAVAGTPETVPLQSLLAEIPGLDQGRVEQMILQDMIASGKLPVGAGGLAGQGVPVDVAKDALARFGAGSAYPALQGLLRGVDSATSLWKRFTLMAPAYFGKKFGSGLFRPLAEGAAPADLAGAQGVIDALRSGQVVPGLAAKAPALGATDAEATAELGRLAFAHQMFGRSQSGLAELATPGDTFGDIMRQIPGSRAEPTPGEMLSAIVKGRTDAAGQSIDPLAVRANPFNLRGVGGVGGMDLRTADQFAPAVAARQFGEYTDDYTRGLTAVSRLLAGEDPAAAAAFTKATQFSGTELAPFEQSVMRRMVPFYSYLRHKIPFLLENVAENPGGLQAMGIRGASDVTEMNRESVPTTLGGGMAIPLGMTDAGKMDYLTRLGLPFDEAASFLGTGPKAAQTTMGKLLGQLNPLLKAPIELGSGEHFGQEGLTDQTGPRPSLLETLLLNSPLARATTTAQAIDKAAEGEKGGLATAINLLTGGKVAEVDPAKERTAAERDLIEQLLSGSPNVRTFKDFYVHPEDVGKLTPQQALAIRLQKAVEERAQATARQQRAGVR